MISDCNTLFSSIFNTNVFPKSIIVSPDYTIKVTQHVVCGKVLTEKNANKSVKTALLLSNIIDVDHQNSCLLTNKGHFSSPSWVLIGVLAKFHE